MVLPPKLLEKKCSNAGATYIIGKINARKVLYIANY